MRVIVQKYAAMNKDAGDFTPFQKPSDTDFRDVTAFIRWSLLHEKKQMPRICQKLTLSDVFYQRITTNRQRISVIK